MFRLTAAILALLISTTGCVPSVGRYTSPVKFEHLDQRDVDEDGGLWATYDVTAPMGSGERTFDPWGDLVAQSRSRCEEGMIKVRVGVTSATILTDKAEDILTGRAEARLVSPMGAEEPFELTIGKTNSLSSDGYRHMEQPAHLDLSSVHEQLLAGNFDLGVWAELAPGASDFNISLKVILRLILECE